MQSGGAEGMGRDVRSSSWSMGYMADVSPGATAGQSHSSAPRMGAIPQLPSLAGAQGGRCPPSPGCCHHLGRVCRDQEEEEV